MTRICLTYLKSTHEGRQQRVKITYIRICVLIGLQEWRCHVDDIVHTLDCFIKASVLQEVCFIEFKIARQRLTKGNKICSLLLVLCGAYRAANVVSLKS